MTLQRSSQQTQEREFFIHAFTFTNAKGETIVRCTADPEPDTTGELFLLFTCPEEWIPETSVEFIEAAKYHGHEFEGCIVLWQGYVPF